MIRLLRIACLTIAFVALWTHPVRATDSPRAVVRIVIAGTDTAAIELLQARLARAWKSLDATVITHVVPTMTLGDVLSPHAESATARVWVDLRAREATLFVVEAGNVFERKLSFEQGFDDVTLELLDVVTTDAVGAVLAGEHLGVTREEFVSSVASKPAPAAPRVAPSNHAPRVREPRLTAGVGYLGTLLAPHRVAHGPSLRAELEWPQFALGFELRGRFPYRVSNRDQTLTLATQGIRLSAGLPLTLAPRWHCVLSLGGGLDFNRIRASSSNASVDSPAPFWSLTPIVSPLLRVEYLLDKIRAALLLGVDIDLWRTSYVVSGSGSSESVWQPWRVRPVAGVAVSYAF